MTVPLKFVFEPQGFSETDRLGSFAYFAAGSGRDFGIAGTNTKRICPQTGKTVAHRVQNGINGGENADQSQNTKADNEHGQTCSQHIATQCTDSHFDIFQAIHSSLFGLYLQVTTILSTIKYSALLLVYELVLFI